VIRWTRAVTEGGAGLLLPTGREQHFLRAIEDAHGASVIAGVERDLSDDDLPAGGLASTQLGPPEQSGDDSVARRSGNPVGVTALAELPGNDHCQIVCQAEGLVTVVG